MPIEIKDVHGGQGVVITSSGRVTDKEYIDALTNHLTQDEDKFKKYRYSLSDYTAVTKADVSSESIATIAELCKKAEKVNPDVIHATTADQNVIYGLARMAQMIRNETSWESMVFTNREEAESWIKERIMARYGINDPTFD